MSPEIILPVTIEEWFRSHRLDELKDYLDVTEKYLAKTEAEFTVQYDEEIKKRAPEDEEEFRQLHQYEYQQYTEKFPRILCNSFLVSACSLLEYEIEDICKRLQKEKQIPISWSDLKGNILERAKNYFKLAGLNLSYNDQIWHEINYYSQLRNCIVHDNGLLRKDDKNLINYVKEKSIISQKLLREVALTPQFCREVVETMQTFLVELEKSINLKSK